MQSDDFYILLQRDQARLSWREDRDTPYPLASESEKDRLIARILQKVLNMRLVAEEMEVFGIEEFQVLGITLFNLLFNSDALKIKFKTFYKEALSESEQRHRFIIEFDRSASDMAALPWEYLFYEEDEATQAFLAAHLRKSIDLVRKFHFPCPWLKQDKDKQSIEPPLRVLVIVTHDGQADVSAVVQPTTNFFNNLKQRHTPLIDYRFIIDPNANNLGEKLEAVITDDQESPFHPHIIHFIGHSRMEGNVGQVCFPQKLPGGDIVENWVNEDTFANYFEELKHPPHLFFLHAPDGVPIGDYSEERGIVLKLMKKNIPFVIALQNPVPDWMAQDLMETFYKKMLNGFDVAAALTESRIQLARKSKDKRGIKYDDYAHKVFGSPVLYTSVNKPFALSVSGVTVEKEKPTEHYKICPDHPNKRFSLSENWCSFCGSRLILPSELQPGAPATATGATTGEQAGRVVEQTQTTATGAGTEQTKPGNHSLQRPRSGMGAKEQVPSSSEPQPGIVQRISDLNRAGKEKLLERLVQKLNYFELKLTTTSDINQAFDIKQAIKAIENQINELKRELGLD